MLIRFLFAMGILLGAAGLCGAQIYEGKYDEVVRPLDKVVEQHNAEYANVAIAGADEDIKLQTERYEQMTEDVNKANERHFQYVTENSLSNTTEERK